jgi:hypothetical protein
VREARSQKSETGSQRASKMAFRLLVSGFWSLGDRLDFAGRAPKYQ